MGHLNDAQRRRVREEVYKVIATANPADPPGIGDLAWTCGKMGIASEWYTLRAARELVAAGRVTTRMAPASHPNAPCEAKRVFVPADGAKAAGGVRK